MFDRRLNAISFVSVLRVNYINEVKRRGREPVRGYVKSFEMARGSETTSAASSPAMFTCIAKRDSCWCIRRERRSRIIAVPLYLAGLEWPL